MRTFASLDAVSAAVRQQLPLQSNFNTLNTRLICQTGINLKKIRPEQNLDEQLIRRVVETLTRMGVSIEATVGGAP